MNIYIKREKKKKRKKKRERKKKRKRKKESWKYIEFRGVYEDDS